MSDVETDKPKGTKIREAERVKESARLIGFKPLRMVLILVTIIVLLLLLMWFFGLGGGGGQSLPGSPGTPSISLPTSSQQPFEEPKVKPSVRRELEISFVPSESDEETARELTCNVSWTDEQTGSRETRWVREDNMDDFEWGVEKTIRAWYDAGPMTATQDVPVIAVRMMPFPGEGTLKKITRIVGEIDPRISILRLEK